MNRWLRDHLLSIAAVLAAFAVLVLVAGERPDEAAVARNRLLAPYLNLPFLDLGDPLHRALLRETLTVYHPASRESIDSLLRALDDARQEQFTTPELKAGAVARGFSGEKLLRLLPMYAQFILVYVLVLGLSTYGAQTLGTYRFVRAQQRRSPPVSSVLGRLGRAIQKRRPRDLPGVILTGILLVARAALKAMAYAVLFSPAYVIAYSFRTRFETDGYLFMIALGVVSNGLLITYANKFYLFLVHESRKGYVETALVKNLHSSYHWNSPDGIHRSSLLRLRKQFKGHLLQHIYSNARYQYIPTLKEQATFLITGLVIIEMALNIQGHLFYELLQNILSKDYQIVISILVIVFLLVKATDIAVDTWYQHESRKYGHQEWGE